MSNEKSWKEVHRILKLVKLKIKEIQDHATQMTLKTDEVVVYLKQLYLAIPKHDGTLFSLSPIATSAVVENVINQIFKHENPKERIFSTRIKRNFFLDPINTPDFSMIMDEALGWATKFEKAEIEKIT